MHWEAEHTSQESLVIPLVSVIIPHRNHGLYIRKRFQSVLDQTFRDFEIILLDDASDDESLSVLHELSNHAKVRHFVANTESSGSAFRQWKRGIDLARGELIWIAESDDYCHPEFLELLVKELLDDKEISLAYCQSLDVDEHGDFIAHRKDWTKNFTPNIWAADFEMQGSEFLANYLTVKNVIPNASAVVFRRAAIDEDVWPHILDKRYVGDWIFWSRMLLWGKLSFLSRPLNYFREHDKTTRMQQTYDDVIARCAEETEFRRWLKKNVDAAQGFIAHRIKRKLYRAMKRELRKGHVAGICSVPTFRLVRDLVRLRYC